eukprot:symbB.v1.2.004526.t3/scaffold257.1/size249567/7
MTITIVVIIIMYEYILPTQLAQPLASDGLAPEELAQRLQEIMQRFEGCHSFHNFTRLKASDCLPREQREKGTTERGEEGSKGGKGKGKEKKSKEKKGKGKGKSKGKDQRGKKRKADVLEAEIDAPETSEVGDTIEPEAEVIEEPMAQEGEVQVSKPESPLEDVENSAQNAPEAEVVEPMKGPWVEVCSKDGGSWKHRPEHVLKHTQSTMHMMTVEPALGGKLLRIVLRGQFFLYNQIRLMVGTAVAIVAGVLPEELLESALVLTTEMHMPMAPATGLLLRTAGFSRLDQRACAAACDLGAMGCACCQASIPTLQKEIGQYHAKYMRIEGAGGHENLKAHYLKEIDRRKNKIVAHPKFKDLPWSEQQWYLQETGKIPKKAPGFDWNNME